MLLPVVCQVATFEWIALLADDKNLNLVLECISTIGNAVVIGMVARFHFDQLLWAIEVTPSSGGIEF
jgi:hypothetical protein